MFMLFVDKLVYKSFQTYLQTTWTFVAMISCLVALGIIEDILILKGI